MSTWKHGINVQYLYDTGQTFSFFPHFNVKRGKWGEKEKTNKIKTFRSANMVHTAHLLVKIYNKCGCWVRASKLVDYIGSIFRPKFCVRVVHYLAYDPVNLFVIVSKKVISIAVISTQIWQQTMLWMMISWTTFDVNDTNNRSGYLNIKMKPHLPPPPPSYHCRLKVSFLPPLLSFVVE